MSTDEDSSRRLLRAREDLLSEDLDGEVVVFDPAEGSLHHLNASASLVWSLCDGSLTLPDMCQVLAEATGADLADLQEQLGQLLGQLDGLGLLEKD